MQQNLNNSIQCAIVTKWAHKQAGVLQRNIYCGLFRRQTWWKQIYIFTDVEFIRSCLASAPNATALSILKEKSQGTLMGPICLVHPFSCQQFYSERHKQDSCKRQGYLCNRISNTLPPKGHITPQGTHYPPRDADSIWHGLHSSVIQSGEKVDIQPV